jgi:hypothetical protein
LLFDAIFKQLLLDSGVSILDVFWQRLPFNVKRRGIAQKEA